MDITKEKVREFIGQSLSEAGHNIDAIDDNTSLILGGLLESLMVVHLVVFIEAEFKIDFSEVFFDQYMFDTINKITEFIDTNKPS